MFSFDYGGESTYALALFLLAYLLVLAAVWICALLIRSVTYVLQGISILRITKKLGLPNGWMAFVPYANRFHLGRIAEESDERAYPDEEPKKWSAVYLLLSVVYSLFVPAVTVFTAVCTVFMELPANKDTAADLLPGFAIPAGVILLVLTIPTLVVRCMILYRVYRVMAGRKAGWMTLLSILSGTAATVILCVLGFGRRQPRYPALPSETSYNEAPTEEDPGATERP